VAWTNNKDMQLVGIIITIEIGQQQPHAYINSFDTLLVVAKVTEERYMY
jgi:hypothetical protein